MSLGMLRCGPHSVIFNRTAVESSVRPIPSRAPRPLGTACAMFVGMLRCGLHSIIVDCTATESLVRLIPSHAPRRSTAACTGAFGIGYVAVKCALAYLTAPAYEGVWLAAQCCAS